MSDDAPGGWLRSIFRRGQADQPAPAPELPPEPEPDSPAAGPAMPSPAFSSEVSFFRLQSLNGPVLTLPAGESLLGTQAELDAAHAVIAIVPEAQPHLCLLATQDGRRFSIAGDTLTGIGISARVLRSTTSGIVRLKQPLSGMRFLTLEAGAEPSSAPEMLRFDGPGNSIAAAFRMLPVEAAEITSALRGIGAEFGAAIALGLYQAEMVEALRAGRVRLALAEAMLRLLPRDELADLSRRLLDETDLLAALRRMLPADAWLNTALPALVAWRANRTAPAQGTLDSPGAEESLLLPCVGATAVPPGLALHGLARGHISPRRSLCLLAVARNEGPYLLEWLAYHLSIGFEHVFLYTDENEDGSGELLRLLAQAGVITLVQNAPGGTISVQEKAYAHALSLQPQILDYRWTAVLDLDEYFTFDARVFSSATDFMALHEAQPVDALALCWLIFASRFGEPYAGGLTNERFTWRAADVNRHVKTVFRTRLFWGSQPHYPLPTLDGSFIFRTEDGSVHHHPGVLDRIPAFAGKATASQGWINHYIFRSAPEALWKLARGNLTWARSEDGGMQPGFLDFVTRAFTDFAGSTQLVSDTRIAACAGGQAAMLEKLLSLPGIAETHETIMFNFELQLKKRADAFLASPVPPDASPALLRFRDALARSQGITPVPFVQPAISAVI